MPTPKPKPESLVFRPGPRPNTMLDEQGNLQTPPPGWVCLPPGDAALTRKVKAAGPTWTVQEKKGRKTFSKGVWADQAQIAAAKTELQATRNDPKYQKKRESDLKRKEVKHQQYVVDFQQSVADFLAFDPAYFEIQKKMAKAIADHATPVGSGTVARTQRIPIEQRAEAAVIAWMRHQTTAYDDMKIARIKGKRREVRRQLAEISRKLLDRYRRGQPADPNQCPLQLALNQDRKPQN